MLNSQLEEQFASFNKTSVGLELHLELLMDPGIKLFYSDRSCVITVWAPKLLCYASGSMIHDSDIDSSSIDSFFLFFLAFSPVVHCSTVHLNDDF